jgi:hypothetical protein
VHFVERFAYLVEIPINNTFDEFLKCEAPGVAGLKEVGLSSSSGASSRSG